MKLIYAGENKKNTKFRTARFNLRLLYSDASLRYTGHKFAL